MKHSSKRFIHLTGLLLCMVCDMARASPDIFTKTKLSTVSTEKKAETFDKFLKHFTSDGSFQFSRIKFPIGILSVEEGRHNYIQTHLWKWFVTKREIDFGIMLSLDPYKEEVREHNKQYLK